MARKMKLTAVLSAVAAVIFAGLYGRTESDVSLTLAITFGTAAYHFVMRLLVGSVIDLLLNNHVDYRKRWFRVCAAEETLYKKLKVKSWKGKMAVPCCWETVPELASYKGKATYSKTMNLGGNVRFVFKGVSHTADVYVDGKLIKHHYNA